jgi:hypothetical protein
MNISQMNEKPQFNAGTQQEVKILYVGFFSWGSLGESLCLMFLHRNIISFLLLYTLNIFGRITVVWKLNSHTRDRLAIKYVTKL